MTRNFKIREITQPDREAVLRLLQQLQEFETGLHPGRRSWDGDDAGAYCDAVTARMKASGGKAFVAEAGGEIVGLIMGWIEDDRDDLQVHDDEKRYGFIGEAIVAAAHRRRGVFDALADAMEQHLAAQGAKRVRTCTLGANRVMQAAAESRGYKSYEVIMEKELNASVRVDP